MLLSSLVAVAGYTFLPYGSRPQSRPELACDAAVLTRDTEAVRQQSANIVDVAANGATTLMLVRAEEAALDDLEAH